MICPCPQGGWAQVGRLARGRLNGRSGAGQHEETASADATDVTARSPEPPLARQRRWLAIAVGGAWGIGLAVAGSPSRAESWGGVGAAAESAQAAAAVLAAAPGAGPVLMGQADRHFIVMMVPHHDGAIAMAELALTRARRPEIRALARSIKASQTAENRQMRSWYRRWYGQELPPWPQAAGWGWQGGMGMGMGAGMGMGRRGGTNLAALVAATDFDRTFIEQMIPHHQMGVMMASMAQANVQHPELRQLQRAMVRVQSDEIRQMEEWYRQWYAAAP